MRKRVLVPVLLLVLALFLYFAPQLPPVRAWLLSQVQSVVGNLGYDLAYSQSAGNAWHGVTLRGAEVTGPGVDTRLGRLEVDYNLLGLLRGRFPFSVSAADVTGAISPQDVEVPQGGGGVPIRPVLRGVTVSGVDVAVNDVPYTLPDLRVADLRLADTQAGLGVAATLATPEGEAQVEADVAFSPLAVEARLPKVDLAVAQHWFAGIEGGQASGTLSYADGEAQADLNVSEAAVTVVGTTLRGLSGPVAYDGQVVTADLAGRALGGAVQGDAVVDIPARQWRADVTGDAKLADAAAWLARGNLPAGALTGDADVSLALSGWQQIGLTGRAQGRGEVYGRPLENLNVDFGFNTDVGTDVQASGTLAGGPFTADLTPLEGGDFDIQAQADGVGVTEQLQADVRADLQQSGGLTGSARVGLSGMAAGRDLALDVDIAAVPGDGWDVALAGDALGAALDGEAALRGAGVTGEVRASDIDLDGTPVEAEPFSAVLSADGPLSALPLTLRLGTQGALAPSVAGVALPDLSGEASAVLEGTTLRDLTAQFGPLGAAGTLDVGARTGRLDYAAQGLELGGRVQGTVNVQEGRLELREQTLEVRTALQAAALTAFGVGPLALDTDVSVNRDRTGASPEALSGRVDGSLTLQGDEPASLDLSGTLRDLALSGTLPADALVASEAAELNGEVQVDAQANLLERRYDLRTVWQAAERSLELSAAGQGGQLEGSLNGDGLTGSFSAPGGAPRFALEADAFTLAPFVAEPNLGATLNGALRYDNTWNGTLTAQVDAPVDATARLIGVGEGLRLEAQTGQGALDASVTGQLLPSPNLDVAASAAERARLTGTLTGTSFNGTLQTDAVETPQAGVPAQTAQVTASFTDGVSLRLEGESADLTLDDGEWSGGLGVPFTLRGETHTLDASVSGPTGTPQLEGRVQGPLVQGPVRASRQGGQASVQVDAAPFLPTDDATLSADLSFAQDLSWSAELTGDGTYQDAPVGVRATVTGEGASYGGGGSVQVRDGAVPFRVEGSGGSVEASTQVDDFNLANVRGLVPGSPTGTATGTAQVRRTGEGLRYSAELQASGTAQGQPLEVSVTANDEAGVNVAGEVAGTKVALKNAASGEANAFDISLDEGPLTLQAQVRTGETLSIEGQGTLRGEPLAVDGRLQPATLQGELAVTLGSATLSVNGTGEQIDADLDAPAGLADVAPPLSVDASVTRSEGSLRLKSFKATLPDSDLALNLEGSLTPVALTGALAAPALPEPVGIEFTGEDGYVLALEEGDLDVLATLSPEFALESLAARGTLEVAATDLRSDLTWQPDTGFAGEVRAAFSQGEADAVLNLMGQGNLAALGEASYGGEAVATLRAVLSDTPWRDQSVSGQVEVAAPVGELSPVWLGEALEFTSTLDLAGSLSQPELTGPVALAGALEAAGALRASRQGALFSLKGEDLDVEAEATPQGWTLRADAAALNVQTLAAQLDAPRLTAEVRGAGTWGGVPEITVDTFLLETVRSRVSGEALYNGSLFAPVKLDVNLAEVGDLRGEVKGALLVGSATTLEGTPLSGGLVVEDAGLAEASWSLAGDVELGGTLAAPTLETRLEGTGSAGGELSARVEPGRYAALTSTLALGPLASDLRLRWRLGQLEAEGQVAFADYALLLSEAADGVELQGSEKLASWRGFVTTQEVQLTGDLSSLAPQLGGTVNLAAARAPAGGQPVVAGTLTGLQFGDTALGNLTLGSEAAGGALERFTLQGEVLAASLDLAPLAWTVSRLELPLPSDTTVRAEGAGTADAGALSLTATSTLAGEPVSLPLEVRYDAGALSARSRTGLLSGTLDLDARYAAGGWSGDLELLGATLQGSEMDLLGDLSGTLTSPTLAGTLQLEQGANTLKGTVALSPGEVRLEQRLATPLLPEPLELKGRVVPLELQVGNAPQNQLRLSRQDGELTAVGALELAVGPAQLQLVPSELAGAWLNLTLSAPQAPGLALRGTLPSGPPQVWLPGVLNGFTLSGVRDTQGSVRVQAQPEPVAELEALQWQTDAGALELNGSAAPGDVNVRGVWRGADAAQASAVLPWLADVKRLPFEVAVSDSRALLQAAGGVGTVDASVDWAAQTARLDADLTLGTGALEADLRYTAEAGPEGDIRLLEVPLVNAPDAPALTLTTLLSADPRGLRGSGTLGVGTGQASVQGQLGWAQMMPQALLRYVPEGDLARTVRLRLDALNVSELPPLQRRLPNLDAPLNGVVRLNGSQVIGQFVSPDLSVAGTALPTRVELSGTLQRVEARASLGRSQLRLDYDGDTVAGFFDLEQFPLEILAEAATDASTVSASATGAARFEVPLRAPAQSYVQVATERLIFKREGEANGRVTRGEVALRYDEGGLIIDQAEFRGDGFWRASGRITRDVLDFSLQAEDADVTPLLSLVPRLAALGVGAQGSLNLTATGSLGEPQLELTSPSLRLRVAGSSYRVNGAKVTLEDEDLDIAADLQGVAPISGDLSVRGEGQLSLSPYALDAFVLAFEGAATLPVLGALPGITGEVTADAGGWQLDSRARLGQPVLLTGSLTPLDLTLRGDTLNINAKNFFVASSATDVALGIARRGQDFVISGDVVTDTARLTPGREENGAGNTAGTSGGRSAGATPSASRSIQADTERQGAPLSGDIEPGADGGASAGAGVSSVSPETDLTSVSRSDEQAGGALEEFASESADAPGASSDSAGLGPAVSTPTGPNPVLQRVLFEGIRLRAQSDVQFRAGFGTAELTYDLNLTGTAAAPELSGVARTLQGTVRFSGKDFVIEEGVARFAPSQGVFPTLDLAAQATFDKRNALGNLSSRYAFIEPREGATFGAQLSIGGSFERVDGRPRPVLDLEPSLSSDAVVQEQGGGTPRPLDEPELVSLLTLGRLQLDSPFSGENSLAGTVAESALDTAVDFLVLSELQDALGDALGVGLFEIRTSAISSLLDGGEDDPFGVSLRVGGYISEDLFASLEVGRFDDPNERYALSNEFSLRYDLAPLQLNFAGEVNFLNDATAVTEFDFSLGYSITPLISLEAGIGASGRSQSASARFGVSFTW